MESVVPLAKEDSIEDDLACLEVRLSFHLAQVHEKISQSPVK
jgi:hypothetical protein